MANGSRRSKIADLGQHLSQLLQFRSATSTPRQRLEFCNPFLNIVYGPDAEHLLLLRQLDRLLPQRHSKLFPGGGIALGGNANPVAQEAAALATGSANHRRSSVRRMTL